TPRRLADSSPNVARDTVTGFFQGKRSQTQLACAWLNARTTSRPGAVAAAGIKRRCGDLKIE
ncbi:TPA: hypothetical protein ACPT1G_005378, partial [Escherichia coli]